MPLGLPNFRPGVWQIHTDKSEGIEGFLETVRKIQAALERAAVCLGIDVFSAGLSWFRRGLNPDCR
jgi:hypothetical protein